MPNNKNNLVGKRFGKLTVISENGRSNHGDKIWLCRCDCGKITTSYTSILNRGYKMSCGCEVGSNFRTHNHSKERLYSIWKDIKSRCNNPHEKAYNNYGGRGITICDEWSDYMVFRTWALSHGYRDDLTIDRIDVNGNYEPSNCRWATIKEQARNKRDTIWVSYKGQTKCLTEWAEILNINQATLRHRICDYGWSVEKAFNRPIIGQSRMITINGKTQKLHEWAEELGITRHTMRKRLKLGIIIPDSIISLKEEN